MTDTGTAQRRVLWMSLSVVMLIRLLSLGAYPLTDSTEARYGEMVRKMVELNDWVTPWFDYGVPFWGKPPLAFWLSAAGAKALGVSEFALRLPSFLLGLGMLGMVGLLARHERGGDQAPCAMLILAASALFFVASGAVLTDTALAFSVTLAMTAFWFGVAVPVDHALRWRYLLFVALGLGLLAKGPVALVLVGAPILLWMMSTGRLWSSIRALPWAGGLLLSVMIALPWYVLAEQRTPGFLEYFLVGEHFQRFTNPAWAGDLYGSVHDRPRGYIWLLWLASVLPWTGLIPFIAFRRWQARHSRIGAATPKAPADPLQWRVYLLGFAFAPGLLFTLAGSVLPTYLLPGLPAFALLLASLEPASTGRVLSARSLAAVAMMMPLGFAVALPVFNTWQAADKSQRALLAALPREATVVYYPRRPFSAQFYTRGRAIEAATPEALRAALARAPHSHVAMPSDELPPLGLPQAYREVARAGRHREHVLWAPLEGRTASLLPGGAVIEAEP